VADDGISYEMLQDLLRTERRSNKLTPVGTRFWHDVRDFLEAVMATFREEQAKDPFSRRVMMVTDEVKHARNAAEGIWALRERKMSLYALAQVREKAPKRPEGMSPDEHKIFDHILSTLRSGRAAILEGAHLDAAPKAIPAGPAGQQRVPVTTSPAPARPPSHGTPQPAAVPDTVPPTPEVEAVAPPEAPPETGLPEAVPAPTVVPADTPDVAMIMIRAICDIPAFVGPDMQTYLLKDGDIATVPEPIATLLERRKKAVTLNA
jgi:DNA replication initiation complex subunit (GINS family)